MKPVCRKDIHCICYDNVINIYNREDYATCWLSVEDWVITFAHFQPKFLKYLTQLVKQSPGTLFQAIQGLLQMIDFPILPMRNDTRWLLNIHFLLNITVKERILDIQLMLMHARQAKTRSLRALGQVNILEVWKELETKAWSLGTCKNRSTRLHVKDHSDKEEEAMNAKWYS